MIPKKVFRVMRLIIDKKNFSPVMRTMQYVAKENKFFWTDSFVLFEFIPKNYVFEKDFYFTWNQVFAIEKLLSHKDSQLSIWWEETIWGKRVIQIASDDWAFYMPIVEQRASEYKQDVLFGKDVVGMNHIWFTKSFKNFITAWRIIDPYLNADTLERWIVAKFEDDFWFYTIGTRKFQDIEEEK